MRKNWYRVGFGLYCLLMLWLLFGQRIGEGMDGSYLQQLRNNLALLPFDTMRRFWWVVRNSADTQQIRHAFINLAGNVVMFVPLGFFLPAIWSRLRGFWRFGLCVLSVIAAIELLQLFTLLGKCDVDDLLLNFAGAVLGYCLCYSLTKPIEK